MPMHRELDDLPLVLCGPILRRVACDSVSVFVALKEPRFIALALYESTAPGGAPIHVSPPTATVALGEHLHVLLVTANIKSGQELAPGQIYGYDLRFYADASDATHTSLRTEAAETAGGEGLLTGNCALGYAPGALPGFVLPPLALTDLRLLHGSCRKPHGEGRDALAVLDDVLRASFDKPFERPQILLLTGDQIYADDVAATLLLSLFETAKRLLGWEEIVPAPYSLLPEAIAPLGDLAFVPDILSSSGSWGHTADAPNVADAKPFFTRLAPPLRAKEIQANARFGSDAMDAHLMFAGEFYLMYLFAWSNVLWPRDAQGKLALPEYDQAVPAFSLMGQRSKLTLEGEREKALEFAGTLRKARRALANIATWMVFDDHEVTDDWNLNQDWVKRVNGSAMGPHLIRNALAAYAIFQDWGNQPEDYANSKPGTMILDAVAWSGADTAPTAFAAGSEALLDLFKLRNSPPGANPPATKRWHYSVTPFHSGQPAQYAITVLDTRTCRGFPDQSLIDETASNLKQQLGDDSNPNAGLVLNAALLSDEAFTEQLVGQLHPARVNIVVSPAPVFGVPIVEDVIQRVMVLKDNPEAHDNEAWNGHYGAFQRLFELLSRFELGVVLLSGDVHYAFSNEITFPSAGDGKENLPQRVVQLCASSLRNETMMTHTIGTIGHPCPLVMWEEVRRQRYFALVNEVGQRIHEKLSALGVHDGIEEKDLIRLGLHVRREWWDGTPSMFDPLNVAIKLRELNPLSVPDAFALPNELVFGGALASGLYDFARDEIGLGLPGNRRFTVQHLSDLYAEREAPAISQPDATEDLPESAAAFAREQCRDIVGYNNLGEITFYGESGISMVLHRLYWYAHDQRGRTLLRTFQTSHAAVLRKGS